MEEAKVIHVFTVRDRPVGFQSARWGGALVAVERGYFPVSETGFRSLSGLGANGKGVPAAVSADFLESLAKECDRQRADVLKRMREALKPVGDPILNYIHANGAYEKAVQDGFFAPDHERAALWAGAHHLLCCVDSDPRFQPTADQTYPAWTAKGCAESLAWARELRGILSRLSAGDFPERLPMRLLSAHTYLDLPPKPGGEPKVDLGGYTAEMALNLPIAAPAPRREARSSGTGPEVESTPESQLGLFDALPTVATAPAARSRPASSPRMSA